MAGAEFRAYLEEICRDGFARYVQTDAEMTLRLNVQTVPELPQGEPPVRAEKVERLPVLAGIHKYAADHVLLSGRPGSGKSTALKQLLRQEAERALQGETSTIPVLIELRAAKPIGRLIQERFRRPRLSEEQLDDLLLDGKLLLLIDGVNEIPSDDLLRELEAFRANNRKTPMIFTTRDLGVRGNLGIAKKLEMQPLTEPQMREFVCAYLPGQGADLLRQLQGCLQELSQTPLLLEMLCEVFRETHQIPQNRGELFQRFDRDYARFKRIESISADLQRWKSELLQHLAFQMMSGQEMRLQIAQSEAESSLEALLKDRVDGPADKAKRWLEDLLEHHLLQVAAQKQIEFHHQLFQEYYAAEALLRQLDQLDDLTLKQLYLNPLDWTETLALMLGLLDKEPQALRVVELALEVDWKLGARLAGEAKPGFQQRTVGWVIDLEIPKWLKLYLLGITQSEIAVGRISQALQDEDSDVRGIAAAALGHVGSAQAVEALIAALQHEDSDVRLIAVEALDQMGLAQAVEALIAALQHEDSDVRRWAAEALNQLSSAQAVEALIAALQDEHFYVQRSAARALGRIGSAQAVDALIAALQDEDYLVRGWAAEALGRIGSAQAVDALIVALQDENSFVRFSAARALGQLGSAQAVDALIAALQDEDYSVRARAAEALGKVGSAQAVEALIAALHYKDSDDRRSLHVRDIRDNAAVALGQLGSAQAVNALIAALQDEDYLIRASAARALGQLGSAQAVDALISVLHDEYYLVRAWAAKVLGEVGSAQAVDALIAALHDEDSDVRENAAVALGEVGSAQAVDALIAALHDEDYSVRARAAEALGKVGSAQAVDALIAALHDEQSFVSRWAARALGHVGSTQAVDALIAALHDEDSWVQDNAAEALGRIGSAQAVDALIAALHDEDSLVRATDAMALGEIADPQPLTQLWQSCRSDNRKAFNAIFTIQERCRFYNYEIEQMALPVKPENGGAGSVTNIYGGQFGDVVAGDKSVKIKGNYIENQENRINPPSD